ncbi:helix-turn-helix transcriptional regulator [Aminicella lysinilytica]|uniref:DNA-binding XRE family transcriptional regulator n=1 Tax=Aminicella lysinilytica TaxID=433323 RepID=A0A4R6QBZ3_9FIRM|nr:helix-turn-helix transcriptional regulator [Aminicella lysinilytica]TDP59815.1 DNA-binding XRE family transcriptional regulator [Aminicella lysinilytica]
MKDIQITLAAARVNAGLTQSQVADRLHVGKQTIVNWEKGKTEPQIKQARALSEIYNMPLDFIFLPSESD